MLEHLIDKDTKALLRACSTLKQPSEEEIQKKKIKFGERTKLKTLVLDMDETMIHSKFFPVTADDVQNIQAGVLRHDDSGCLEFNIFLSKDDNPDAPAESYIRLNVKVRKHLEDILMYLSTMYEIAVFTAGEKDYADTILDFIDGDRTVIKHRLYRQHCVSPAKGIFVKDLRVIADRDLKDTVLVDNSIVSFAFQLSNGIPIAAFTGDNKDEELLYLVTYLEELFTQPDVRAYIDTTLRLNAMMQEQKKLHKAQQAQKSSDLKKAAESQMVKDKYGNKQ
jgi:CTD small phosphatase-like protein 2